MSTAPVSAVIVTHRPRLDHLGLTLDSLADQASPPVEVLLVDSTPGQHAVEAGADCALCADTLHDAIARLRDQGATVEMLHDEGAGIGHARRRGADHASNNVVWHLDEDAVIATENWTERALAQLDDPGVAAVGGSVVPLRNNGEGRLLGQLDALTRFQRGGWYIMYPKRYCEGDECLRYGQGRGEDYTVRDALAKRGALVRDPDLLARKDLPTTRQQTARNLILGLAGGAAAGAATDSVIRGALEGF